MATVRKRDPKDSRWTAYWTDERGERRQRRGYADKAATLALAIRNEDEARKVRDGLVDPAVRTRRDAAGRSLADHLADYRDYLDAKGNTARHSRSTVATVARLCGVAKVRGIDELTGDRVLAGLAIRRAAGRSPRTLNADLGAVQAFAAWLAKGKRIAAVDEALADLPAFNQSVDRRLVRRALTMEDVAKLLAATEGGPPVVVGYGPTKSRHHALSLTGPERAALYRLAMGTGFRANELRSLTPESFRLDGPEPYIAIDPASEKRRKGTDQPITPELAEALRPFLQGKPPGVPVLRVPEKTAKMLRADLARAGIPAETIDGRIDFHGLRATYATHLLESGANPKVVMVLLRVSSLELVARYVKVTQAGVREALKRKDGQNGDGNNGA